MTSVVVLLLVNGVIGTVDTLWYHELRGRLAWHPDRYHTELRLHAGRDAIYAVLYGTIGWWAWQGWFAAVLAVLLLAEIAITLADFVVEDRTRPLSGGERVLHSVMAIVYGTMLARLLPELVRWWSEPTAWAPHDVPVPAALAVATTVGGVGIACSGARDLFASTKALRAAGPLG